MSVICEIRLFPARVFGKARLALNAELPLAINSIGFEIKSFCFNWLAGFCGAFGSSKDSQALDFMARIG